MVGSRDMLALANAHDFPSTVGPVGEPADETDVERNERLRAILDRLRIEKYDGNLSATARALGMAPPSLSDILKRKRGVGLDVLVLMAEYFDESLDVLVFGRPRLTGLSIERGDRYPERAEARRRARRIYEQADAQVAGQMYARAEGKPVEWWMRRIEEAQLEARRELEDPEGAEAARAASEAKARATAAADEAAMEAAAREDAALPPRARRR